MSRVVILTGHFANQKRKGSMLWVSEALHEMGWDVTIATVGYSWLSVLRRDGRLRALGAVPDRGVQVLPDGRTGIFRLTPVHPMRMRFRTADALFARTLDRGFVQPWVRALTPSARRSDVVLIESGAPIALAAPLKTAAPRARLIYRVNDDMRLIGASRWLLSQERAAVSCVDRISTASPLLAARFADHPNVTLDPMGIPTAMLQTSSPSPFISNHARHVVCAGSSQIDLPAIQSLAEQHPDWQLHIFGRIAQAPPQKANITWHGETAFADMLPYVAHADMALAAFKNRPGIEYQANHSNRILLYRHFDLPILAPPRLAAVDPALFDYTKPAACAAAGRQPRRPQTIPDWSVLARRLVQNAVTLPAPDVATVPATLV